MAAMTILFAIVLATLHLEDDNLIALYKRLDNLTHNFCAFYGGRTYLYCTFIVNKQYLVKFNSLTFLSLLDVVYKELLALFSLELLTVNLYDCVHF